MKKVLSVFLAVTLLLTAIVFCFSSVSAAPALSTDAVNAGEEVISESKSLYYTMSAEELGEFSTHQSGCTAEIVKEKVKDTDSEDNEVLKLTGTTALSRFSLDGSNILNKGMKVYISFDAKTTDYTQYPVFAIGNPGNNSGNRRFFLLDKIYSNHAQTSEDGSKFYINGTEVTGGYLTFSTNWRRYGFLLDLTNENMINEIEAMEKTFFNADRYFLIGQANATVYIDNLSITCVKTVKEAPTADESAANVGSSIRRPIAAENNDGKYQTAGIRFKADVTSTQKAAAAEIGFIVAPSAAVVNADSWYDMTNLHEKALSGVAYNAEDGTDIVYEEYDDDGGFAYQMVLSGLSTADGKTAYKNTFVAVMYIKDAATGDYAYYELGETSYNRVKAVYAMTNIDTSLY